MSAVFQEWFLNPFQWHDCCWWCLHLTTPPSKYVQIEQSTAKYGYIYGVFSRAVPRKKAEEFLSALDTVRFKYQKQDQQYIKVKDDYDALQEKVCILKADNDQLQEVKEELQQEGMTC